MLDIKMMKKEAGTHQEERKMNGHTSHFGKLAGTALLAAVMLGIGAESYPESNHGNAATISIIHSDQSARPMKSDDYERPVDYDETFSGK